MESKIKSTKKIVFKSGFQRDTSDNKPRFDLIPYEPLESLAKHYYNGAKKYGENNWKLAKTDVEIKRFRASALRHLLQWANGDTDEDHASACIWNIMAYEWHTKKEKNSR